jgi:hypothetical protein
MHNFFPAIFTQRTPKGPEYSKALTYDISETVLGIKLTNYFIEKDRQTWSDMWVVDNMYHYGTMQ